MMTCMKATIFVGNNHNATIWSHGEARFIKYSSCLFQWV